MLKLFRSVHIVCLVFLHTVSCRKVKMSMTKLVQSAEFVPTLTLLALRILRAESLVLKCRVHELVEAAEGVGFVQS